MLNPRTLLLTLVALVLCLEPLRADPEALVLTRTVPADVAIVLPDKPGEGLIKFADLLQKRFQQSLNRKVPIVKQSAAGKPDLAFNIGPTDACLAAVPEQTKLPPAAYVVKTDGKSNVFFAAKNDFAVGFAVVEFCDKVMNDRQYMPAPLGECITTTDKLAIPADLNLASKPVLASVFFSGVGVPGESYLTNYKEMEVAYQLYLFDAFHHAFFNIIPPKKYGKEHPDWYPMVDGVRRVPDGKIIKDNMGWQPNLASPSFFQHTVDYCVQYFNDHPEAQSVSIAVNDGGGWDTSPEAQKIGSQWPGSWARNIYYDFVNRVAVAVARQKPGKMVGISAYGMAQDAPPFPIEKNVLVYDVNPDPVTGLKPWHDLGAATGVYNWLYGADYATIRYCPHVYGQFLKTWINQGAQGLYCETYPNWIVDAPMLNAVAKLGRNPDADVDALLAQYSSDMFGKQAAPAIIHFYQTVETAMKRRFHQKPNEDDFSSMSAVGRPLRYQFDCWRIEDVAAMDADLAQAAAAVAPHSFAARRLDLLTLWWNWSREYILTYANAQKVMDARVQSVADVDALLPLMAQSDEHRKAVVQQWDDNMSNLDANPAVVKSKGVYMRNTLSAKGWQDDAGIWIEPRNWAMGKIDDALTRASAVLGKTMSKEALIAYWNKLADDHPEAAIYLRTQAVLLAGDSPNLIDNGSFERVSRFKHMNKWTVPEGYVLWNGHRSAVTEDMGVDNKVAHSGTHSWRSGEGDAGWLDRTVSVTPGGRYLVSVWVRQTQPDQNVSLNLVVFGKDAGILDNDRNRPDPGSHEANAWYQLQTIITVPQWGDKLGIDLAASNRQPGGVTWFDDLSMVRLY